MEKAFLTLVCVQAAHSVEEYIGRLWVVFPPARFFTGLISTDRQLGFIVVNVTLITLGVWCVLWPVHRRWRSARVIVGLWAVVELINGLGHCLWSIWQGSYTPGLITAPVLFCLASLLIWHLTHERKAA